MISFCDRFRWLLAAGAISVVLSAGPSISATLDEALELNDMFGRSGTAGGLLLPDFEAEAMMQSLSGEIADGLLDRIARDPGDVDALRRLALHYARTGRLAEARATLERVLEIDPRDVAIALDIAKLTVATEGAAAARKRLEGFRDTATDPFPFQVALIQLVHDMGARDEARRALTDLLGEALPASRTTALRLLLARYLKTSGDDAGAAEQVDAVLDAAPRNADALAYRALFRLDALDLEGARSDIAAGLAADPGNVALLRLSARAEWRAGQREVALDRLREAVQVSGHQPDIVMDAVSSLEETGSRAEAIPMLERAVQLHPAHPVLLARLGAMRLAQEDWEGAEAVAVALRQVGSPSAVSDSEKIRTAVLQGRGETEEARALLRQLGAGGSDLGAVAAVVNEHLARNDTASALAYVETLLGTAPGQPALLLMRASLRGMTGADAAAEADYRAVVRTLPQSALGHVSLARHLMRMERPDQAEQAIRAGLSFLPNDPSLKLPLVEILLRREEIDEALSLMEELVRAYPDNPLVANNYVSLVTDHAPQDPERIARAAAVAGQLRASPIPQLRDTYGWLLHRRGEHEAARKVLETVLADLPEDAWANYHAGMIYKALGQRGSAIAHLRAAVASADASFSEAATAVEALRELAQP